MARNVITSDAEELSHTREKKRGRKRRQVKNLGLGQLKSAQVKADTSQLVETLIMEPAMELARSKVTIRSPPASGEEAGNGT